MKVLAVLATMAIAAVMGATAPLAAERTAKLNDPATTGQEQVEPRGALENPSLPSFIARTGLSEFELERIRASIRGHIRALTARDADAAYDILTPLVKDYYNDSNSFLKVLTSQLKPLANARSFAFAEIAREDTQAVQSVVLIDPEGREWIAEFRLERQGDGRWAIQGCQVERAAGRQT